MIAMNAEYFSKKLNEKGLKVTPQRIAILEALVTLNNHPTADNIIGYIKINHPHISTATVYKVLDAFIECGMIKKVKTANDIMRYDGITENHHHIYCFDSECIEDYNDEELIRIFKDYFDKKQIPDFTIEDLKLHIIGKFTKNH